MSQSDDREQGRRIRVLAVAESCNPEWESVPMVGWQHSQALARRTDFHLVTRIHNAENLARAGWEEGMEFTAIDSRAVDDRVEAVLERAGISWKTGKGWTIQSAVKAFTHQWFERLIWQRFGAAIANGEYDVVHRITPLSPVVPSPLARWSSRAGTPFVLGPLNGGLAWPKQFDNLRAKEGEALFKIRDFYKLVPRYRSTRADAAALVVGSGATFDQIPERYRAKAVYITENAVDPARFSSTPVRRTELPVHVAFVGRFVPVKCIDVLIEAAAPLVRAGAVVMTLIGDGPELPALRDQVAREELGERVTFTGWVRHDELQYQLAQAHVFGFPSVKDFGGGAVLEAMAMGLVPIVVNYGGPGELVSPQTGFAVPLADRASIVASFRSVLERLVADPTILPPMATRARTRVLRTFTWDTKADQMLEVYRWVLGARTKPDFGMPHPDPVSNDTQPSNALVGAR